MAHHRKNPVASIESQVGIHRRFLRFGLAHLVSDSRQLRDYWYARHSNSTISVASSKLAETAGIWTL
jgi:hypothetical protein